MKVTILVDNLTFSGGLEAEWGFSCFIEVDGKRILFDVGETGMFMRNAKNLNIDVFDCDYLVFSHGHHDHTGGLHDYVVPYIKDNQKQRPIIVGHPHTFWRKFTSTGRENGSFMLEEDLNQRFSLQLSTEPVWLSERLVWLGQVPRIHPFEKHLHPGYTIGPEGSITDYMLDDTALAYKSNEGLVIITGCSHTGICNIIEHAKEVCQETRIADVIGGLHLIKPGPKASAEVQSAFTIKLAETVAYLKGLKLDKIHVGHCTSLPSLIRLSREMEIGACWAGVALTYDE